MFAQKENFLSPLPILKILINKSDPSPPPRAEVIYECPLSCFCFRKTIGKQVLASSSEWIKEGYNPCDTLLPCIKRGNSSKYMIDGIVPTSLKEYHCWNKELFGKFWALKPCSLLLIHQIGGPQTRQNHFHPLQCMQNAKGKPSSPTRLGKVEPGGALSSTLPCQ